MHIGHAELFPGKAAGLEKEKLCSDHHYTMSKHLLRGARCNGKRPVLPLRSFLDSLSGDRLGPVTAFSCCVTQTSCRLQWVWLFPWLLLLEGCSQTALALGGNVPISIASSHPFVHVPTLSFRQNGFSLPDHPYFCPRLVPGCSRTPLSRHFARLTRPASVRPTVSPPLGTLTDRLHTSSLLN